MYSDKAIKAIIASHKPAIIENTGYRLTTAQIKAKIEALRQKAERDPEHAEDYFTEIEELEAIIKGKSDIKPKEKSVRESQYLDMIDRLSKTKTGA